MHQPFHLHPTFHVQVSFVYHLELGHSAVRGGGAFTDLVCLYLGEFKFQKQHCCDSGERQCCTSPHRSMLLSKATLSGEGPCRTCCPFGHDRAAFCRPVCVRVSHPHACFLLFACAHTLSNNRLFVWLICTSRRRPCPCCIPLI